MKNLPRNERGLGHMTLLTNLELDLSSERLNIKIAYLVQHVLTIV